MRHNGIARGTMPVHLTSRDMHHITNLESLRRISLRADQAGAHEDRQDLAALVLVPESAGAWREADVVSHAVWGAEDRVHVDGA